MPGGEICWWRKQLQLQFPRHFTFNVEWKQHWRHHFWIPCTQCFEIIDISETQRNMTDPDPLRVPVQLTKHSRRVKWPTPELWLVHVRCVIVRQVVVWTFDSNVLDLPPFVWIWGAAGAQLVFKQSLDFLQTPAFGLRQTTVDEDEAQQGQTGVEEEGSWEKNTKVKKKSVCSRMLDL